MRSYKIIKKLRKNGDSLAINIPKDIVEFLNLKEDELLEIYIKKIK